MMKIPLQPPPPQDDPEPSSTVAAAAAAAVAASSSFSTRTNRMLKSSTTVVVDSAPLQPFDWLTSASSIVSIVQSILTTNPSSRVQTKEMTEHVRQQQMETKRVLHVGCGSSLVGELIVMEQLGDRHPNHNVDDGGVAVTTTTATTTTSTHNNKNMSMNTISVVNVDCDIETLQWMQQRWQEQVQEQPSITDNAMQFVQADFTVPNALQSMDGYATQFDVIVDKSTLDCMLCTDTGAVGLLLEVYRLLKDRRDDDDDEEEEDADDDNTDSGNKNGVYLVVSFHPPEFIVPLLANLPGADWEVSSTCIPRHMEPLNHNKHGPAHPVENKVHAMEFNSGVTTDTTTPETNFTWSSGTFQPDERYLKTVTVVQCRLRRQRRRQCHDDEDATDTSSYTQGCLDWDTVHQHVRTTNQQWYQQMNPMLTTDRIRNIEQAFANHHHDGDNGTIDSTTTATTTTTSGGGDNVEDQPHELNLSDCYHILLTDGERENLEYEDFVDDWKSFLLATPQQSNTNSNSYTDNSNNASSSILPSDRMSCSTAIAFFRAMQ
jgi:hypothetical protein